MAANGYKSILAQSSSEAKYLLSPLDIFLGSKNCRLISWSCMSPCLSMQIVQVIYFCLVGVQMLIMQDMLGFQAFARMCITNTQTMFILTRLPKALYDDLPVQSIKFEVYHHFLMVEVSFWCPLKTVVS